MGCHRGPSSNSRTSNVINLRILMGFKPWILQHCKISIYFSGVWLICGSRRSSCFWLDEKDVVFQNKSPFSGGNISEILSDTKYTTTNPSTGIGSRKRKFCMNHYLSAFKFVSHLDLKSRASFNAADTLM